MRKIKTARKGIRENALSMSQVHRFEASNP
jgi:hypothetical protein